MSSASEPLDVGILVIGAGPSGLAVSACLKRHGEPHALIEREPTIGASWRRHYDRLHLHTAKEHSALPGMPFPASYPTYPSREEVVAYLDRYAAQMELDPWLGVEVTRARREGDAWHAQTRDGRRYRAHALIVATGYNAVPNRAAWPGLSDFPGAVLHACEYKNGAPFEGRRVLVVGSGNSGAEIAIDLWESRAAEVAMSFRSPVHVVPRDAFGLPAQHLTILMSRLPTRLADKLSEPLRKLTVGDLSRWGIQRPEVGPLELLETTGRVPLIDIGTIALIKQGAITVHPDLARLDRDTVHFVDGRARAFDAIVLATGYRAGLSRWLECGPEVLDARGLPRVHGHESALPGLYFLGFRNPTTGNLREIALEAERIADDLHQRSLTQRHAGRPLRSRAHAAHG